MTIDDLQGLFADLRCVISLSFGCLALTCSAMLQQAHKNVYYQPLIYILVRAVAIWVNARRRLHPKS